MDKKLLDLYSDYLLSSFGATTATGLSSLLDGQISHDQVTRFLSQAEYTSKELWHQVKTVVRTIEREDGVLIFDDTIQEKPYTDENELICWHFDHSKNRSVKGLNLLNCIYQAGDVSVPVAYELVRKPIRFCDRQTRRVKRKSEGTKNQLLRQMLRTCQQNRLRYRYVLADSWFAAKENLLFIRQDLKKTLYRRPQIQPDGRLEPTRQSPRPLRAHRHAGLVRPHAGKSLDQRTAFSRLAAPASLYKQRRFHRHVVSGPVVISTHTETPLRRSIKNDGKSKSFTKRSSPMPRWPSHRPNGSVPKATTSLWPSMRPSR